MLLNTTGIIGQVLMSGTENVTGSFLVTLFIIIMALFAITMALGIPIEVTGLLFIPLLIGLGAYYSIIQIILIPVFLIIAYIIAKNWLFK